MSTVAIEEEDPYPFSQKPKGKTLSWMNIQGENISFLKRDPPPPKTMFY